VVNKIKKVKKASSRVKKKAVKKTTRPVADTKSSSTKEVKVKKNKTAKPKSAKPKTKKAIKKADRKPKVSRAFSSKNFPIVGIGASAGGLEALEEFFASLDSNTGMAFVIITHQHPKHISILDELLRKYTRMDMIPVTDRTKVRPNCVYLSRAGKNMEIFNGTIHLSDPVEPHGLTLPIDLFFRSLARDQGIRAICIILSGTGTDGTLGLRAIKGESGMAMVQDESSAKFSGMPDSALNTGLVDYTLQPSQMPEQLIKYVKGPFLTTSMTTSKPEPLLKDVMQKIFLQLRNRTGHDFSGYKTNTTRRRIERRMNIHHLNDPRDYLKYMQENTQEAELLFKELLIGVTSFFRDPEAFEAIAKSIIPDLLKSKKQDGRLRVWVPGCASGEEVYSLAILFNQFLNNLNIDMEIQIFGTDLDSHAIDIARAGLYPVGIAADISKEHLKTYFDREGNKYRIRKNIRGMVVFAPQNIIKDPPFTKLDMISCRNLLIYLEPQLQKQIFALFHYALNPCGLLFLGNSESLGSSNHLFKPISPKWKIFSRKRVEPRLLKGGYTDIFGTPLMAGLDRGTGGRTKPEQQLPTADIQTLVEKYLLKSFAPASVMVDERGEIFYIHGRTGAFLEPVPGKPLHNIIAMAREGLKFELTTILRKASHQEGSVIAKDILIKNNGGGSLVNLSAQRLTEPDQLHGLFLVTFETSEADISIAPKNKKPVLPRSRKKGTGKEEELRVELQYTKENLQSTIEELETTNEELKSTNEELQSTNEELQSSNEEIETSKEEMQSLNEELQTTNTELQAKIDDYSMANDDMKNLLNSTDIATIFLDNNLNIKRFTLVAQRLINLIASDVGRPIGDIVSKLKYDRLAEDCKEVIRSLAFKEEEVQTKSGHWYLLRILPYRTEENKIDGLVVTFIDIDRLKKAELKLEQSKN